MSLGPGPIYSIDPEERMKEKLEYLRSLQRESKIKGVTLAIGIALLWATFFAVLAHAYFYKG